MATQFEDQEMQELFESYLIETQELLESLSGDLVLLENESDDPDLINRIFRGFHTIKGTSSFMGFDIISTITHHAEDVLNKIRKSELQITDGIVDVLLEVQDWIELLVGKLKEGEELEADYDDTIAKLEEIRTGESSSKTETEPKTENDEETTSTGQSSTPEQKENAVDSVLGDSDFGNRGEDFTADELALLEEAFKEVNQSFSKKDIPQETEEPEKEKVVEIKEQTKASNDNPKESAKTKTPMKSTSETIRIDIERIETLMDLSGELVLARNRLTQITENVQQTESNQKETGRELVDAAGQIDYVTSEIQSAVMRMRMVPIGKLYQKAPRIVRDLSREFGKKINLIVKGEETEIDRGIIEELNDPLVHMIRNSCDHGIESPEIRKEKGKPEKGTLTLDAEHEGNNIVLYIKDDGAGIDPDKIKSKAIEKGVISEEQAMQMSDKEVFQLIFAPGFSTAAKVSSVSGRGVGMDVVKTNIQKLKGIIDIESKLNQGTTLIIKLPLTLAIIQGLLVKVGNETYAIPLSSVIEVVAVEEAKIKRINQSEVIRIRDEVIPISRMEKILDAKGETKTLEDRYVVNIGLGIKRLGLIVDELLGQQEIVIKSLGEYLGDVKGIAGSTILGDGRVIMIVDVSEFIESHSHNMT